MVSKFSIAKLGEVARVRSGFAFKSSDWRDSGVPVVKMANVKDGRLVMSDCSFVSPKIAASTEFNLQQDDIVISMTGAYLGDVAWVRQTDLPAVLNQRVGLFSIFNDNHLDRRFLFYFLRLPKTRIKIYSLGYGSAQPNISPLLIHSIDITLPSILEQRFIGNLLGTLDDKIELNRRMNQTLEAMARAIFKSWFVDFEPARSAIPHAMSASPLGQIPPGWRVDKLSALCSTQYGLTASAVADPIGPKFLRVMDINKRDWIEWASVPHCPCSREEKRRYELSVGDILVARMADPGKATIIDAPIDAVFASYLVRLKAPSLPQAYFVYGFLKSEAYLRYAEAARGGSVQANMNAQVIVNVDLVVPPDKIMSSYFDIISPLRQRIAANVAENFSLTALRDTLLPKLLSGEIRVKQAENAVAEVI